MTGSCWLSALLSASYLDVISISLVLGQTQAFFTCAAQPRRSEAAAAHAAIAAASRLTHYEKRRIRDSAIPVQRTTGATKGKKANSKHASQRGKEAGKEVGQQENAAGQSKQ